ncbi:phosphatidylserine decarboxylase family protein [Methylacidimicrobium tartarophylax]|uniref:Phosphatidylserine decarboxylase proenzyme n=1 Tax=Methylacidimicrobium tartarophylax TaxID=1041768 RepID=A0A5E6M676_9BACT|nr:phosphatidylserine decarboxylase family protein [Methylacidimicrobium tartarophylax]VVM04840.1 phosphatidylserine decarboxylase [Methylacidimicrobium tartarophylax]
MLPPAIRDALPLLAILAAATVFFLILPFRWSHLFGTLLLLLLGFVVFFFRDPERRTSQDPDAIVAPADGKVVLVDLVQESPFSSRPMRRVAIFLSVFDVHVNRAPVAGIVTKIEYTQGSFFDARRKEAAERNERQDWWIESPHGMVGVRQIAGLVARRIVAWTGTGVSVRAGERIGMIRFGSRTELYLPEQCRILVEPGRVVHAGETVVGRWP